MIEPLEHKRESLARMLCELSGINPDNESVGLAERHHHKGRGIGEDRRYKLWEWQAEMIVDPILAKQKEWDEDARAISVM